MAFAYRAFYAIPPMSNRSGVPTNAAYGFVRMLGRMVTETMPDFVAAVFDTKEPTFRHKQYAEYKAQRPPMPDELAEQIPWIKEYVRALNIPCLEYPGYEADDVIATIACRAVEQNVKVLIATSDKDLCQLVSKDIGILNTGFKKAEVLDSAGVEAKFGVEPRQIVDYLTLVGDSSDNIPGVRGIGPKTAQSLLREYETLDGIYSHISQLAPRVRQRLEQALETVYRFKALIRVKCDVPLRECLDDLAMREPDSEKLARIRQYLGFQSPGEPCAHGPGREPQMELFQSSS